MSLDQVKSDSTKIPLVSATELGGIETIEATIRRQNIVDNLPFMTIGSGRKEMNLTPK
tara:strand:- start:498 stop:671 length:174 start_codon:yes stop_codon:yes gene_type:complete